MKLHDVTIFTGLVVVCVLYALVGTREMRGIPLLTGYNAIAFELAEIAILIFFTVYGVTRCEYGMTAIFALALLEHVRQVSTCDRQASDGPRNVITLVEFSFFAVLAIACGIWWAVVPLCIGALIHLFMLVFNRPLIAPVCLQSHL